jgi:hypothetical protein
MIRRCSAAYGALTVLILIFKAVPLPAGDRPGGVLAPGAEVHGKTLDVWADIWWQWALAFRDGESPIQDLDPPVGCSEGQGCDVWFLAGINTPGDVQRDCTMPAGKHLFFPILNFFWVAEGACAQMCARAQADAAQAQDMFCSIDGEEVTNLTQYLQVSAGCWILYIPDNNVFGPDVPGGCYEPMCTAGYYIMLEPLSPGDHVIRFGGRSQEFWLEVTYWITVEEDAEEPPRFRRGDANSDGNVDVSDAVFILQWLFSGGGPPSCPDAADGNDSGGIDLSDAVYILSSLFLGGCRLPWPGPEACRADPTPDALGECSTQPQCCPGGI